MKAVNIRLADEHGQIYRWQISRVPRAVNCTNGQTRIVTGWQFTDHEGYSRFSEGTWLDLVPHVKMVASNYGLTLCSELS